MNFKEEPKFEKGLVVDVKNGVAKLEVEKSFECKGCHLEHFCMKGNENKTIFEMQNSLNAEKGDRISFEIKPGSRIASSFLIFIMPLLTLCLVFIVCKWLLHLSQNLNILISLISFSLSFFLLKFINSVSKRQDLLKPKMIDKLTH